MCKKFLIPMGVLVFVVGLICPLAAQPSEEEMQQMSGVQLLENVMEGMMPGPQMLQSNQEERDRLGITKEQWNQFNEKMVEAFEPFEREMEKFGDSFSDISPGRLGEAAEAMTKILGKADEVADKVMRDNFPAETIKRIETASFQKYGGAFGGALNVKNLAPLNLSAEQKEKARQIIDKLNRERLELVLSLDANPRNGQGPDVVGITEKIVSLTKRGQREIEDLLTPEQKKQAEKLMADIPEEYRFLNDYLANRPWRLDESSWKPGDGPPATKENWPGETRPERPRGERVFPEN